MRKLTLELDELCVESFATEPKAEIQAGTVQGYANDSQGRCGVTGLCGLDTVGCYQTLACTFTANADCLDTFNCTR